MTGLATLGLECTSPQLSNWYPDGFDRELTADYLRTLFRLRSVNGIAVCPGMEFLRSAHICSTWRTKMSVAGAYVGGLARIDQVPSRPAVQEASLFSFNVESDDDIVCSTFPGKVA